MTLVGALAAWVLARSAGVAHELLKVKLWVQGGRSCPKGVMQVCHSLGRGTAQERVTRGRWRRGYGVTLAVAKGRGACMHMHRHRHRHTHTHTHAHAHAHAHVCAGMHIGCVRWNAPLGVDLPENRNRPSERRERTSVRGRVQNHLRSRAGACMGRACAVLGREVARRNLGVRFRLIRAVSTRRPGQSCIDPAFWA